MRTSNLIHQLVFDLSLPDMQTDGAASADWIKSSLLPVIDQVLEDICVEFGIAHNEVKRIEKIDIDLGCILQTETESELARRLHAQLRNTLFFHIHDPAQDITDQTFATEAHQDLFKFLQTGHISWKNLNNQTSAHKKLLQVVLKHKLPQGLLRSVVSNHRQLLRLVRQFDTATLFAILRHELREWPEENQDLLFDWLSLELVTLNGNRRSIEEFWLSLLPIITSADQTFNAVIQTWLTLHQKNKNQVLRTYQNFLEKNSDLSHQSHSAMNEAIQRIRKATISSASSEALQTDKISDQLTQSHRLKLLASRISTADADYLPLKKISEPENNSTRSGLNTSKTENHDEQHSYLQVKPVLLSTDSPAPLTADLSDTLLSGSAATIRAQHRVRWKQWINELSATNCLDLIAVLQEHCTEYVRIHLKKQLPALNNHSLDQLITYAISAPPGSLHVQDLEHLLYGSSARTEPSLKTRIQREDAQKKSGIAKEEAGSEIAKDFPQSQILTALKNADVSSLSKLWNLLISRHQILILKLLPEHKMLWLNRFPLRFLSDIGKIVQSEASRAWQPKVLTGYAGPVDAVTRAGFDILFSEKSQTLSIKSFITKIKALIQDQPSLADILESIVENDTVPSADTQNMPIADENDADNNPAELSLQSALCSDDKAILATAIEYALANDVSLLIHTRPQRWCTWWKNLPNHLLVRIIWRLHTSLRPQLQSILSITNDAYPDAAQRIIPLLLASTENSFSSEQLNAFIQKNRQSLYLVAAENNDTTLSIDTGNIIGTHNIPDHLHELTKAFQSADIQRINAIWPELISGKSRQLQSTWALLSGDQKNSLIALLPLEKQLVLIQILYPEFAFGIKELHVYAPVLTKIMSEINVSPSLTKAISADVLLENISAFFLRMMPSPPATTMNTMLMASMTETLHIDADNLRRICESPKLADTRYLRHINSFQHTPLWTGTTPLAHSFIDWQEGKVQLEKLHLTREELLRYLHWSVWHQNAKEGKDLRLLLHSIREAEKKSTAPELFLQAILEAIRNNVNIDIDSLRRKAEHQPEDSSAQSQFFKSERHNSDQNFPKNTEIADTANHIADATRTLSMENITLFHQLDQAMLSDTGWNDLVDLLKRQPEILMKLYSAQLHQLISTWLKQTTDAAVSSAFLDEMENLAGKANSIRLFYVRIIRQLLVSANADLKIFSEIGADVIDDHLSSGINSLTETRHLPTTKQNVALNRKSSFSAQLLHLLSGTASENNDPDFAIPPRSDVVGENENAGQLQASSTSYQSRSDQFADHSADLNNPAFRQWTCQWLNLTGSTTLDDNPSDQSLLEAVALTASTETFADVLQAFHVTAPASIVKTFQAIADSSFHLNPHFWSFINNREQKTSVDSVVYQQCVALLEQLPWKELAPDDLPSAYQAIETNVVQKRESPLALSTQAMLTGQLAHALLHSQLNKLSHIWPELIQYHGDLLAQAQRHYLRRVDLREKLIADHDPAILKDLVAVMSHTAAKLLDELWQHWEIYRPALVSDIGLLNCQQKSLASVFTALIEKKADTGDVSALATAILTTLTEKPLHHSITQEVADAWRATSHSGKAPHWHIALRTLLPYTDWHKHDWQKQVHSLLKQSDPATTREFWQSAAQHLEKYKQQLVPTNARDEKTSEKNERPDYLHQSMVVATLKLLTPSLPSPDHNLNQSDNSPQMEQATFDNWASQCTLLLQKHAPLSARDEQYLNFMLEKLLDASPSACDDISLALYSENAISRLIDAASCSNIKRLYDRLAPELSTQLPSLVTQIENALGISLKLTQTIYFKQTWLAIYRAAFGRSRPVTMQEFVTRFLRELCRLYPLPDTAICLQLLNEYCRQTEVKNAVRKNSQRSENQEKMAAELAMPDGDSYVMNAGLVIVAPYIQRLFSILELTKNAAFVDETAAERAIHLLQYIVTGEEQTPEYQLSLNKLLCGIHGGVPIVAGIQITDHEKEVIQQMLLGVITNWSAIGKTSIQGLRETFLQREGHLYKQEDGWQLHIPSATFDMLLDRLPWSFAMIKFPWMSDPLHVTWR